LKQENMNFAKRMLMVVGGVAVAGLLGAILTPKAAHGIVATLVQVVNTPANPVPTVQAPAVLVATVGPLNLVPDGTVVDEGPYDLSSYGAIRFYGDPVGTGTTVTDFKLIAVDANGKQFQLDDLVSQSGQSVTGFYQMPGASLLVRVTATCNPASLRCFTVPANFDIYGR
jgi:hypothetical protein